jgi:HSP20 family protein
VEEEIGQIALDIIEHPNTLCIVAPVAGIDLSEIDVFMNKNTMTIRGKRKRPQEIYTEDAVIKNSECFWGKFVRNVILPENLDFSQIKALMENNLLVITIPKMRFHSQTVKIDRIDID